MSTRRRYAWYEEKVAGYASPELRISDPCPAALGYLAAIVDGDGFFAVSPRSKSFGLAVQMLDKSVIDWLHEHFAGFVSKGGLTVNNHRVWRWTLQRQADLRFVLRLLQSLLIVKAAQAQAMLTLLEHLAAQPKHHIPMSRAARCERTRRRMLRRSWEDRTSALRRAVQPSAHPVALEAAVPLVSPATPTGADWGYLAGILDGEGHFMPGVSNRAIDLRVQMVNGLAMASLAAHFGGRLGCRGRTEKGLPVFEWRLQRQPELRSVLLGVAPMLVCKREQARAMLAWLDFAESRKRGQRVWSQESLPLRVAIRDARHISS